MSEHEILERADQAARRITAPDGRFDDLLRRRQRRRRNQRLQAGAIGVAIFAIMVWIVAREGFDNANVPASPGTTPSLRIHRAPAAVYTIDLGSGALRPLPGALGGSQFAVSPDGSRLAYVRTAADGADQIFVARIDGVGAHQVTNDPGGASWPAWSPDGTSLVYVGHDDRLVQDLFILDLSTGSTKQIPDGTRDAGGPSFTPDGSSLVYTSRASGPDGAAMRIVPIAGGKSTILFGGGQLDGKGGMGYAGGGSMSPDGSLVAMTGNEIGGPGALLAVSQVDGTHRQVFGAYGTTPSGTWSPDGTRIVARSYGLHRILVIDVVTGIRQPIAEGHDAIWIDDHTLLIED